MSLVEKVRLAGVVGAGGGGFPAHLKLSAKADTVIANGAECEPLLHKDAAVMGSFAAQVVRGVQLSMEAVGATDGVIGVKAKNKHAVKCIEAACKGTPVRVHLLGDYYPAGDEYDLVYEVTGRLIPPGGIPLAAGVVVNNVETLANIAAAADGKPVTHKTLTIGGAVKSPVTLIVPIGTPFADCIAAAGGVTVENPVYCYGGLMMGETSTILDRSVTKTSTGVIVLPREHPLIERKLTPPAAQLKVGKSACDQCRACTELCPRFLLGYQVQPHQVMRSLSFTATGAEVWNEWAALCCSCGLCSLYSCPEGLFPKTACDDSKATMRAAGLKWNGSTKIKVHPMRDGRRTPVKALSRKLNVVSYEHPAPLRAEPLCPKEVILPLKQSAGSPSIPTVKVGDEVTCGQSIAEPPPKALGSIIHAPFAATVTAVTAHQIILKRKS